MPQLKIPGFPQTDWGYGRISSQTGLIIPMPTHAVFSIPIKIKQHMCERFHT